MRTHNHCNNWGFCVFLLYSFCMILICFHVNLVYLLIERVRLFRFLFCSPDGCNGQCWTRLKPGAGNFFQVSHVDHQGAGSEMEQWGHNPLLIWDIIYCMWQFNSLSHNSGPIVFFIRLLICFHFFPLEYSKRDDTCVSTGISSVAFFLQNIHRFIFFQFLFEVSVDGSAELSCPLYWLSSHMWYFL